MIKTNFFSIPQIQAMQRRDRNKKKCFKTYCGKIFLRNGSNLISQGGVDKKQHDQNTETNLYGPSSEDKG